MSKSDTPLEFIDVDRARKPLGKPDFAEDTALCGMDTETADGDIFAIAGYYEDTDEIVELSSDGEETLDGLEVLNFLTLGGMRSRMNVWFNLNFDVNVILKALPRENVNDIKTHGHTDFTVDGKEYGITYIPKKALRISVNGHSYNHYDVSQFTYAGGLDDSADVWLGDGKADENVDVKKFGLGSDGSLNDYTRENLSEIVRYLRKDCKLTARIMREVIDTAENELEPGVPFGSPFSTGYVAADYFRNRSEYKPGYTATRIQSAAWESYYGGRFEVIQRGNVGPVAGPDINSAYPAVMAELPDPQDLTWKSYGSRPMDTDISELDEADMEKAALGFVRVEATTDPERPIQPFAVKNENEHDRVEYPALENRETWTILDNFLFARDEDFFQSYELKEVILGFENDSVSYPFSFFKDLYAERKALEADGRDKAAKLVKIVMNSIYGKTCQTTVKLKAIEDFADEADLDVVTADDIPEKYSVVTDPRGDTYLEYQTAGRLFNPILAAYITGRTRLQLLRAVVENGLESDTVMLATDCLMLQKDAFESSPLYAEAERDEAPRDALGGWDYDYVGDGFVVGSGVYQVNRTDVDEIKHGMRGFKDFYGSDGDETLMERAARSPDGIPLENTRPVTYGDILQSGGKLSEIGVFRTTERTLSADMDTKRVWSRDSVDFSDLLAGAETGKPKIAGPDGFRD